MCLYSSRCLQEGHAICLLNEEPPTAMVWWLKGTRVLFPICPFPLCNTSVLWDLQKRDVSDFQCQDCQRNCLWDTARVTALAVHWKATSVLLTGPLQETWFPFFISPLTLRLLISQLLSRAVLTYASLAFPGSALPLAGTSVCMTVTDQSSHQNWVKMKLARKNKRFILT